MRHLQFIKTIDVAVRDKASLDFSVATWEKLLGADAIEMKPEYSPAGGVSAFHVPMPTGELACHSIGVFLPTNDEDVNPVGGSNLKDFMEKHGESTFLLSFMVENVEEAQAYFEGLGFKFFYDEPVRYAAGAHNFMQGPEELQDLWIHICRHDEGGLERWLKVEEESGPYAGQEMGKKARDYS